MLSFDFKIYANLVSIHFVKMFSFRKFCDKRTFPSGVLITRMLSNCLTRITLTY